MSDLETRAISVIRGLAMDAVNAARSGHQGTAMALAPLAHVLFTRILTYDADAPDWPDRDRFVLSAGHASILQYSLLYLTGFGLSLDDLRDFRQWGSLTPGHPEAGHTPGVEVTTGPLGQGIANAVGMAIAEEQLRARFGADLCDHRVVAICSDGDLEEGISHEAASLAGHLRLGRLLCVYDDNHISIDGPTELTFSDDTPARFRAYGWDVVELGEVGDDLDALEAGLRRAMEVTDRPSLVVVRTHIGTPAPRSVDTPEVHGYALFDEEIAETKALMGLPPDETFFVPDDVLSFYREAGRRGRGAREAWTQRLSGSPLRLAFETALDGAGESGWADALPRWEPGESIATRKASNACLRALAPRVPALTGGGADLTGNTGTALPESGVFSATERGGRQIYFGVREHAMGAIATGMARHGGALPVVGTFFVFSDYMRGAVRLAALSRARVVFVWSHDSVGVGEDGPTHQPVEHLAAMRAMPGLLVVRPADATETAGAWRIAVTHDGPTALVLTRQNVSVLAGTDTAAVATGGYPVVEADDAEISLVATGSEVGLCVDAAAVLAERGVTARVVSLPCWELFAERPAHERDAVLRPDLPRLGVEAAASLGWHRWVDEVVAIDRFGASASGATVMDRLGFTPTAVADRAQRLVGGT